MRIFIKVIPGAKKAEVIEENGSIKIKVCAKPEKGKANREVLKLLAEYLGKKESELRIVVGEKSKNKIIEII